MNQPALLHGQQERGRRGGTENVPGIVGFGVAAQALAASWPASAARMGALRDDFEQRVRARWTGARINGAGAARVANTSSVRLGKTNAEWLLQQLDAAGVCASSGAACSAAGTAPSHVLLAMGQDEASALAAIRFSFGPANTRAEVDRVLELLERALQASPEFEEAAA
jgi:cysteine desulfurase